MDGHNDMDLTAQTTNGLEIAVIGMAGRFPGADNLDQYWRNIEDGTESVRPLTSEALPQADHRSR